MEEIQQKQDGEKEEATISKAVDTDKIVISRYPLMHDLLVHKGIVPPDTPYSKIVAEGNIDGKHVFGTIPIKFTDRAKTVTTVHLDNEVGDLNRFENLMKAFRGTSTRETKLLDTNMIEQVSF